MESSNYVSRRGKVFYCSDHRPVAADFLADVSNKDVAQEMDMSLWQPLVMFFTPNVGKTFDNWSVNKDGIIQYTLAENGDRYVNPWDWIGLFEEQFTSLEDYITFTWASNCHTKSNFKQACIKGSSLNKRGRYILLYISVNASIFGMSKPVDIK